MIAITEKRHYTPEEYLALEETAEYKSEYHDGEIIPMTGGTTNHNQIAGNFYAYCKLAMKRQNYKIFIGDVRLGLPRYRRYVYPDVMIIEGKPVYDVDGKTTVTNPLVIVEVLSKSTRNYDKGDKFYFYRSIPEFREYILIDQERYHVEQYAKTAENKWLLTEYDGQEAVLAMTAVSLEIPFLDIYEGVEFEVEDESPAS
ncbi:MAG TPA: Uma2 family endonuclease [Oscillatoriaceae cyanobacterium M33_DOE_052]|uniref:Uma2 family endonuclease n=1 Tax=Planktothricoides sp. SpSt-374 TaxID=2282167 RepID=A0A7C3VSQ5_9CYAN|nr:Uma2 family endonuclease [Oscillatoriaceae cyanobacterium M33_DOE_052]